MCALRVVPPISAAIAHWKGRRLKEAAGVALEILAAEPENADALHVMGALAYDGRRLEAAERYLKRAVELAPERCEFWGNYAGVLIQMNKLDEGEAATARALALNPAYSTALNHKGSLLMRRGRMEEAIGVLRGAAEVDATCIDALVNLGLAHMRMGNFTAARDAAKRVLQMNPEHVETRLMLAFMLLEEGKWKDGFEAYEWRWRSPLAGLRRHAGHPLWHGEDLQGKSILLHMEQGFGDALQFVRYAKVLKERGAKVLAECLPALKDLLVRCPFLDAVRTGAEAMPRFDFHLALLDLPRVMGTEVDTVPAEVPYIFADARKVKSWAGRMVEGKVNVGLVWSGNADHQQDRMRSILPELLGPLGQVEGVVFHRVQPAEAGSGPGFELVGHGPRLKSFDDTAALVANLDLVISVDTAAAHLAGAMARPVWTMVAFRPDWRWLQGRADTVWYPTMRLFRQRKLFDWEGVIADVAAALRDFVAARRGGE